MTVAGEVGEAVGEVEVSGDAGLVEAGEDEADLAAQGCDLRGQGGGGVPGRGWFRRTRHGPARRIRRLGRRGGWRGR